MSMYSEYVRERAGDEILETEEGFATYRFIQDDGIPCVYILDIFIRPDFRRTKIASSLADKIVAEARSMDCVRLLGSVSSAAKNATDSIKVLLGYGMEFYKCSDHGMIFKKDI